ncbi:MAG: glycine betaine/L-proline ABC transporter substrate-binding protein ProX [Acidimicrobiia bacterium]|nr:glycine betaine/L-proline ABC transporter substrate-binding protein ProX [Acidimicrobiia bacterium]
MKLTKIRLFAVIAALALVVAACGDDDSGDAGDGDTATTTTAAATTTAGDGGGDMAMPGEGVEVTQARADWSTGYFQAYVYHNLLEELGYDVSDPADSELGPSLAYLSMAQGDIDFWVNSWMPGHLSWFEPELPDGSQVGDHLTVVGEEMIAGGLQGFLVTKTFAEEFDIKYLSDIVNNPDALAAFDAEDPVPGNGVADIYGCQQSFTCDDIIQNIIAFNETQGIQPEGSMQQVIAGYDAMAAEATAKADEGTPMVIYTWTPSAYITNLRPGDNVVWLGVKEVLDDSNPAGLDGGAEHDQRPGTASIGEDQCPSAADLGTCQVGWVVADILVTANTEFLEANPAAAELLELVKLPVIDVSLANVAQSTGADTNEAILGLAEDWIEENRATVDAWLEQARAAAG